MHTSNYADKKPWPFARIGYLAASCFGFLWGFIFSTEKITKKDRLYVFTGLPNWAFGRGGVCIGCCYLTNKNTSEKILKHEQVHQKQWLHYGLALPILYFMAGRDPHKNRFEIEAGLEDGGYI